MLHAYMHCEHNYFSRIYYIIFSAEKMKWLYIEKYYNISSIELRLEKFLNHAACLLYTCLFTCREDKSIYMYSMFYVINIERNIWA